MQMQKIKLKMPNLLRFSVFICAVLRLSAGQNCESKVTCDKCIQEFNCFWCSSANNGTSHCLSRSEIGLCEKQYIEDPKSNIVVLEDRNLADSEQIKPQRIKLELRKNEKYEIKFQYRQSANYPVDLYYIMDHSNSMLSSKHELAKLGGKLVETMQRKTNDFRIGFGSFVDKLTLPFVNTYPEALKNPCPLPCAPPYSFKNHLSLIPDAKLFSQKVLNTEISGNLDTPEGGLDAIMQAIVCKDEIGWRPNARHLLVMSTDSQSHIAGDGKLGGVIEPNDATCHMENHTYTHGLINDYPSVSQINYVARQNNINLIFAIVLKSEAQKMSEHLKSYYSALSAVIENSKTGSLEENSENVVKFISDIYDQIRESVKITSNVNKKEVDVNITANCGGGIPGGCNNLELGQIVDFKATIEPLVCHKDDKLNKKTVIIKPESLEDQLVVELEVICDCECASDRNRSQSPPECNEHGDLECGICRCYPGRFGANCQCDWNESKGEDPSLCVKPDGKGETCSGQGRCKCGKCECKERANKNEMIYGKYCECDNFSCPQKCSGRGTCDCGVCQCDPGWIGEGCDCSTDQRQCMALGSTELCSGHGNCVCGHCQCVSNSEKRYAGKFCERCTNCPEQRCDEFKNCVECQAYKSGVFANVSDCALNCTGFTTKLVKKLNETVSESATKCRVAVEGDCTIVFEYTYNENGDLVVIAEEEKICPYLPPLLVYIHGVIGSVLLLGILTLIIWKVVTTAHDKNEYARFLNEKNNTKWNRDENPLYKPGTSHFQNPVYNRASNRISLAPTPQKLSKPEPTSCSD